jgi:hypothetical protein
LKTYFSWKIPSYFATKLLTIMTSSDIKKRHP